MRVLIVAASPEPISGLPRDADVVIGVDGGYQLLLDEGIEPNLVVGDFDSFKGDVPSEAIRYPVEKDLTDLEIALEAARTYGATVIDVYGGLGGRLDMTLGNIGLLEMYPEMRLHAQGQTVFIARKGTTVIKRGEGHYLSFIPWKEASISITGVKYPLVRRDVSSRQSLTISNEWTKEEACLTVHRGQVLVLLIKK